MTLSARWQELFWALPQGPMRSKLRSLEIDTSPRLRDEALTALVAEMRSVAMAAGQYSVECAIEDAEAHAAYAARLGEWATRLDSFVSGSAK